MHYNTTGLRAIGTFVFGCALVIGGAPSGPAATPAAPAVVVVDGTPLSLSDVEHKNPAALFQARNTFYQAERKAVDDAVDDYLLERQAQREHLTLDQLLEKHVNSTIAKDPSEEALHVYYEGLTTSEPYDKMRPQILSHIRDARMAKAKAEYLKTLHAESQVSVRLDPPRVRIPLQSTPVRGPADAPLMIVEYADFECPYCQQAQAILDKIEADYKGKVAVAYKDVPLPMHAHAEKAAEAAHCAGLQGKYWEYHDLLFKTKQLAVPDLKEHAKALRLDTQGFDKCLDSGEQAALVANQLKEGQSLQLQGTPSFFVNGRFFSGSLTYEQLHAVLEEELSVAPKTQTETARK